jgi:hypothetical protein
MGIRDVITRFVTRFVSFRARDIRNAAVFNGDNLGTINTIIGDAPRAPDLRLQWMPLPADLSGSASSNVFTLLCWQSRLVEKMVGRDGDFAALTAWARDDARPVAIRLLTGPGGAGKSRLANEVATALKPAGWNAGLFRFDKPCDLSLIDRPTFLFIDYPEEKRPEVLALLSQLPGLELAGTAKLRVLLLSRQPRPWWDGDLAAAGVHPLCDAQDVAVGALDAAATCALVAEVARRFGAGTVADAAEIAAWHARAPRLHGLPLFATAAAVHCVVDGDPTFTLSGAEILAALVLRERRRLEQAARAAGWRRPAAAARLHGLAALRGGLAGATLTSLARQAGDIGLPPPDEIVDAVRGQGWWADDHLPAPQPDLLAAELLHQTLGEAADWLAAVLDSADSLDIDRLDRLADDIATLHPGPGNRLVAALIAAVTTHPPLAKAYRVVLDAPVKSFRLAAVGAAVGKALLAQEGLGDARRAGILNNLANCLSMAGDRPGALTAARRAVEIREVLAAENPAAYRPDLAMSLNTLANRLSETGDRLGALTAARRTVEIREALAAENPAAYRPNLAVSLNNLAIFLSETGDRPGALDAARRAVEIYQALAAENSAAYRSALASSLNNLATFLSETGDRPGALDAARRAVEIYQALAAENPAAYRPDLAMSINNLANRLSETGDRPGALTAARRAVEMYQALAAENPAAYRPDLAMSLNNLAAFLSETGDHQGALTAARRSVEIYQALAEENAAAFGRYLDISRNTLAAIEAAAGEVVG